MRFTVIFILLIYFNCLVKSEEIWEKIKPIQVMNIKLNCINTSINNQIMIGSNKGIYELEYDSSWKARNSGIENSNIVILKSFPSQNNLIASDDSGYIYLSTNLGITWQKKEIDTISGIINSIQTINDTCSIIFKSHKFEDKISIYLSKNKGDSWELVFRYSFSLSLHDYQYLLSGVDNNSNIYIGYESADIFSIDLSKELGSNFKDLFWNKIPGIRLYGQLKFNKYNNLFACGYFKNNVNDTLNNKIFRSTLGGLSWESCDIQAPCNCLALNGLGHIFIGLKSMGLENPVMRSTDNGVSWDSWSIGLNNKINVVDICVNESGIIYIISENDIFRTTKSTNIIDNNNFNVKRFYIYPNPIISGDVLNIMIPENIGNNKISIYNYIGELIDSFSVEPIDKNIIKYKIPKNYQSGTYYVMFSSENKSICNLLLVIK